MTADQLAQSLDAKWPNWALYRAALGHWCVKLGGEVFSGDTLTEALEKADSFVPLPKIPRRPTPLLDSEFRAVKAGAKWTLQHRGYDMVHAIKTSKEAMDLADDMVKRSAKSVEQWDRLYAARVDAETEGVDFVWGDL